MSANLPRMPNRWCASGNVSPDQLVSAVSPTPARCSSAITADVPGTMPVSAWWKYVRYDRIASASAGKRAISSASAASKLWPPSLRRFQAANSIRSRNSGTSSAGSDLFERPLRLPLEHDAAEVEDHRREHGTRS